MSTSPLELEVLCELLCRPLRDAASDFFINDTTSSGVFHFINIFKIVILNAHIIK